MIAGQESRASALAQVSPTDVLAVEGRVFDVQRFSIHDGPGIRTTVFMKGCPLRCSWCHNPEGISRERQLSFLPQKCIGCGTCQSRCPHGAQSSENGEHVLVRTLCRVCGACAETCYSGALEIVGRDATVQEIVAEVLRDRPFYDCSGGGMTLSGGEPVFQIEFTEALLRAARAEGLHCAIETCGYGHFSRYERIAPLVGLFLYDIKDTSSQKHVEFTGVSNALILSNLRALHERGAQIILRLPVIPGHNDRDDHFRSVAALCRSLPKLLGAEVMPYHALGRSKLDRFGMGAREVAQVETPSKETVGGWLSRLRELGVPLLNEAP